MIITNAIIAAGECRSNVVDLGDCRLHALNMPDEWDDAPLFLLVSTNGKNFRYLHIWGVWRQPSPENTLAEYGVAAFSDFALSFDPNHLRAFRYVMLQSGAPGTPVNQTADRTIELINW